jgi:DNA-binding transcriptional ArsR family regulator
VLRDRLQLTVSHHLKVLREAGWVHAERRGTNVSYTLRPDAVDRFREFSAELRPGVEDLALQRSATPTP